MAISGTMITGTESNDCQLWPDYRIISLITVEKNAMQSTEQQTIHRLGHELLIKIFETSPTAITVVDRNGRIIEVNPRAEKILHLHRSDLTKRVFDDPQWAITDYDGNEFPLERLPFMIVRNTRQPVFDVHHAITLATGQRLLLRINASPLFDEKGDFDGMVAQIEDDTESVRATRAFIESEAILKSVFRAAPVGIAVVVNRNFTWVNNKLQHMVGYSEGEMLGHSSRMLYRTQEEYEPLGLEIYRQIQEHGTGTVETHWVRKDGSVIDILLSSTPIDLDDFSKGVTVSALDITERRQMEERLRHSEKMEAVGQLAGGIAHDFNNQLAGIMGYADLLRTEITGDPEHKDFAEKILIGVRRAADLTAQLLAFARKGKYLSVKTDIHAIITEVVSLLCHTINKNISIIQRLTADTCLTRGDPSQLQNAILNLAINARDAMSGGGTLTIATDTVTLDENAVPNTVYAIDPGDYITVRIGDTGEGMESTVVNHMFEPFYTTKGEGKGTGLGLAAVYGTMKMHGGGIAVRSALGEGTEIVLYLPVFEESLSVPEEKTDAATKVQLSGKHIVLIDDEEEIQRMVPSMLSAVGAKVTVFGDGQSAIDYFGGKTEPVDAVILDLVMPGLDAKTTFRTLRKIEEGLQVCIASGYSVDGEAQQLLDEGARGFVQKPFLISELIGTLSELFTMD